MNRIEKIGVSNIYNLYVKSPVSIPFKSELAEQKDSVELQEQNKPKLSYKS